MIQVLTPRKHDPLCNSCYAKPIAIVKVTGDGDTGGRTTALCTRCAMQVAKAIFTHIVDMPADCQVKGDLE